MPGAAFKGCRTIKHFETLADGQIAALSNRSGRANAAIAISRFLRFSCEDVNTTDAAGTLGVRPESEVGQRFWARWASNRPAPQLEIETPEVGTTNNQLPCNQSGEDRLVFQFDGRWGIQ